MRPLTVLTVAYPFAPVGPDSVGGAEQIAFMLDAALTQAGHRSVVLACEGSSVAGKLISGPAVIAPIEDRTRAIVHEAVRQALARAITEADVVHMHGIDFSSYLPPPGPPVLVTLHLPPSWYPADALAPGSRHVSFVCVSASQRAALQSGTPASTILNGVPVEAFEHIRVGRETFALMLGRICPEKGQHLGLRAAKIAGVPLLIAGAAFPYSAHQEYLHTQVIPGLDEQRHCIGPVGFERKRELLAAARCVLVPSLAPETSSLVAMEAAACGAPVIAFRAGALAEIVRDGVTGFVVDDVEGMANAIMRTAEIDPGRCRAEARVRFRASRMTSEYLALYRRLAAVAA
jgi:glycosyltransferase involved in cell wall biosynthesis